jgi:hypothetical protein
MSTNETTETDPWTEAAMDLYHLNDDELRAKAVETVAEVMLQHVRGRYFMEDTGTEDLAEAATAVLDAITPLLETTVRQSCATTALDEGGEHALTCHGYAAAERISLAIVSHQGPDELGGDRTACGGSR